MLKRLFALSGFKIALAITIFVMGLFLINTILPTGSFLNLMDKKWVDYIMRDRGVQPHSSEVAIATIDIVAANAAVDIVVALAALEVIVTLIAKDRLVATAAHDDVVGVITNVLETNPFAGHSVTPR